MARQTVDNHLHIYPSRDVARCCTMLYECVAVAIKLEVAEMFPLTSRKRATRFPIVDTVASTTWDLVDIGVGEGVWRSANRNKIANLGSTRGGDGHDGLDSVEEGRAREG